MITTGAVQSDLIEQFLKPVRDMAKALCLTLPDAGSQQVQDSDDVRFLKVGYRNDLRTKATFHLGDAIDRNQR